MKPHPLLLPVAMAALLTCLCFSASAQQHVARRLGNPQTRFAPPLQQPEDLRKLFDSDKLRADIEFILRECGYTVDLEAVLQAARTAPIRELQILVGTRLPAMSARKEGRPVLLRDVLWAGDAPIDAYEFVFTTQGRRYRVVTPKACSNFWLEDLGALGGPVLELSCTATPEVGARRPARVCLTLRNTGESPEPTLTVTLPFPAESACIGATRGAKGVDRTVVWEGLILPAGGGVVLCADFVAAQPGTLNFHATARGTASAPVEVQCASVVQGIPAVLLEVIDLEDPVEVNGEETYQILVVNQGSLPLTNVRLDCQLEDSQAFVSGDGPTAVQARERTITIEPLTELAPGDRATWRVRVKPLQPGDVRFGTTLGCDQIPEPIRETEATRQY